MKFLPTIFFCLLFGAGRAQAPVTWMTPTAWNLATPFTMGSLGKDKKISVYGMAGMQSGAFNYGSFSATAVKPLTKNWFAFGGVLTAMPYTNCAACLPGNYRSNLYQVHGGLMYTNEARTFSVSGSVRYGRSSFPAYGPHYVPANHNALLP
ncbi:MAG TPA: hypothetical protein PLQ32_03365 [Flavihumibacter sp.]|nr:hypothetical protein [Bacteroidota bacterium]HOA37154.1 hypothetical protein [Flavihumibacter sp.]HPZ87117.1 hypothetical protein [Flavihumibacter sp.]